MNYFQRPSEQCGDSIKISKLDSTYALANIIAVNEVLQPNKIIFVSTKAYDNFMSTISPTALESFNYVGCVPHPSASSWWNRTSPKYGTKLISTATGRENSLEL